MKLSRDTHAQIQYMYAEELTFELYYLLSYVIKYNHQRGYTAITFINTLSLSFLLQRLPHTAAIVIY